MSSSQLIFETSFSVFGSISWPCVPIIVDDKIQGTSYGLMSAFQNSAQFIVPLILAEIFRMTGTYSSYELCFMTTSFLAVLLALWIWYHDGSQGGKLRAPATFRD
jgi:nitrate/nitrite transporter NarK